MVRGTGDDEVRTTGKDESDERGRVAVNCEIKFAAQVVT